MLYHISLQLNVYRVCNKAYLVDLINNWRKELANVEVTSWVSVTNIQWWAREKWWRLVQRTCCHRYKVFNLESATSVGPGHLNTLSSRRKGHLGHSSPRQVLYTIYSKANAGATRFILSRPRLIPHTHTQTLKRAGGVGEIRLDILQLLFSFYYSFPDDDMRTEIASALFKVFPELGKSFLVLSKFTW